MIKGDKTAIASIFQGTWLVGWIGAWPFIEARFIQNSVKLGATNRIRSRVAKRRKKEDEKKTVSRMQDDRLLDNYRQRV